MKLREYLKINDLTEAKFGEMTGLSQASINRYCADRVPDKATMPKIIAATGGAVQPNDFFAEHLPNSKSKHRTVSQ